MDDGWGIAETNALGTIGHTTPGNILTRYVYMYDDANEHVLADDVIATLVITPRTRHLIGT